MILVDASGLFALLNDQEPAHDATGRAIERETGMRILSPFVLAEVDHLLITRAGLRVELEFLDDVHKNAYELARFDEGDVAAAATVIRRYADLKIGLADASVVVLAERYGTNRVLTLDERHFRALRVGRRPFVVLPADA